VAAWLHRWLLAGMERCSGGSARRRRDTPYGPSRRRRLGNRNGSSNGRGAMMRSLARAEGQLTEEAASSGTSRYANSQTGISLRHY
jgi:hypothetical protein